MADETVIGKGGSLTFFWTDRNGGHHALEPGPGPNECCHPHEGTITSVDVHDGGGGKESIDIKDSKQARIVIHYEVP